MNMRIATLAAAGAFLAVVSSGAASAQDAECAKGGALLKNRQGLMSIFQGGGKKPKMTAAQACARLTAIVANGRSVLDWHKQHGAWCNVPDALAAAITNQNGQVAAVRAKACAAAAQQKKMETLAKQQPQQNPFGADDVTGGPRRLPQGAL